MTAESMVIVEVEDLTLSSGGLSTELPMHLFFYKECQDGVTVMHAHPPYATGFATASIALDKCVLVEVIVTIGRFRWPNKVH